MISQDVATTMKIAAARIHVEREREHIKNYELISKQQDATMFDILEPLISPSCVLTNSRCTCLGQVYTNVVLFMSYPLYSLYKFWIWALFTERK